MRDSKIFDVQFRDNGSLMSVIVHDDGRVAYAYLLRPDGSIASDVWLYNRCVAPKTPEWTSAKNMPFANPADYAREDNKTALPTSISQFTVSWLGRADGRYAQIFVNNYLFAELNEGVTPGWSSLAVKNGPLARVLESE